MLATFRNKTGTKSSPGRPGGHFCEKFSVKRGGGANMAPLPEIAKNSQKITFREFNPIIIIKLLLMIVKNQKPPF